MFLTGFADEAGRDLAAQIRATRELGWKYIESRAIGDKTLATLNDAEFDALCEALDEADIRINCYGSAVANWAKDVRNDADIEASKEELAAALPRMEKLGIKMIRGMSFAMIKDGSAFDSPEIESRTFKAVRELVKMCGDHGVIYGHENCMNYGGLSYRHTLKLLDAVSAPNFKLIFDTGNPCFNYRCIGEKPYPLQSSWEFYRQVRKFIAYVHIKDATALPQEDWTKGALECRFTYPGEGCGDVRAIVRDLKENGYDGGFSIEPHVAQVFHDRTAEAQAEERYSSYVKYGKQFEQLLRDCGWNW